VESSFGDRRLLRNIYKTLKRRWKTAGKWLNCTKYADKRWRSGRQESDGEMRQELLVSLGALFRAEAAGDCVQQVQPLAGNGVQMTLGVEAESVCCFQGLIEGSLIAIA
jgi:hypothetical protein